MTALEVCPASCRCFCHSIAFNGIDATPEQIGARCISCGSGRARTHSNRPNALAWMAHFMGLGPRPRYAKREYGDAGRFAD